MVNHAVILATSISTYHGNLANDRSPVVLPALGKPLVVRAMDSLYRNGINRYTVIIGLNESTITSYLDEHWVPNVEIEYHFKPNTESLSKTIRNVAKQLQEPFLFVPYNSFVHHNYFETLISKHKKNPDNLIITGAQSALATPQITWTAKIKDEDSIFIQLAPSSSENPLLLTPISACGTEFTTFLSSSTDSENANSFLEIVNLYQSQIGSPILINTASWFLQVESDKHLLLLNNRLMQDGTDAHILSELPQSVRIVPPVRIDPQVNVGERAKIGPFVYLERGCSIGSDVTIQNSLVLDKQNIRAGSVVQQQIIHCTGTINI